MLSDMRELKNKVLKVGRDIGRVLDTKDNFIVSILGGNIMDT